MAPPELFQDYLYRKYRAIFIDTMSETAGKLALLDVLVKTGSESEGFLQFPHPVLVRCGSMAEVGTYTRPEDQQKLHDHGLDRFDECTRQDLAPTYDTKLFQWIPAHAGVADRKLSSSASLETSLAAAGFGEAGLHFSKSNNLTMQIEQMETASVDKMKIASLVKAKLWKPIPSELWQPSWMPACVRHRKVWVVHEILFASKLTVTSDTSSSVGGKLTCNIVPATPGVSVDLSRDAAENTLTLRDPSIHAKYPGKIMFAFRAQCFHFSDAGEYVRMEGDAGRNRPMVRRILLDKDRRDIERSEIRDLFEENAPSDFDSDSDSEATCLDLRPLPILERPAVRNELLTVAVHKLG